MKTIAKVVFKIHRKIYKYPTKSEIRLVLMDEDSPLDFDWFIGMLYLCGDSVSSIAKSLDMSEQEIKDKLNYIAKGVKL
jgi:hypothetical protein